MLALLQCSPNLWISLRQPLLGPCSLCCYRFRNILGQILMNFKVHEHWWRHVWWVTENHYMITCVWFMNTSFYLRHCGTGWACLLQDIPVPTHARIGWVVSCIKPNRRKDSYRPCHTCHMPFFHHKSTGWLGQNSALGLASNELKDICWLITIGTLRGYYNQHIGDYHQPWTGNMLGQYGGQSHNRLAPSTWTNFKHLQRRIHFFYEQRNVVLLFKHRMQEGLGDVGSLKVFFLVSVSMPRRRTTDTCCVPPLVHGCSLLEFESLTLSPWFQGIMSWVSTVDFHLGTHPNI